MRPTRAEIHLDHFLHNLRFVRERIGERPKIMPIIKANAYGHGLEIIARAAEASGEAFAFGVATEEEGVQLRKITEKPILVLTGALSYEVPEFIKNRLDFTLADRDLLNAIAGGARALGTTARVHVKIDTGMHRIGIAPADAMQFLDAVKQESDAIELVGLSTHFATSDELDLSFFDKQLHAFETVVETARRNGFDIPLIHAANSGAILQRPKAASFTMVRPGIMLYGYTPSLELDEQFKDDLQPALGFVSEVVQNKRIRTGEGVSYNLRWRAPHDTSIVTIPLGYGDGYFRTLTNRTQAIVHGKAYPVVGTICMDQVMMDVGSDNVPVGSKVHFIVPDARSINAWTLAKTIGTIPYEILTAITARVPRVVV